MKTPEELAEECRNKNFNYCDIENNFEEAEAAIVYAIVAEEIRKAFLSGYAAAQRWISVEEELPPIHTAVLLTSGLKIYFGERQNDPNSVWYVIGDDWTGNDFTYWLPLPPLPTK